VTTASRSIKRSPGHGADVPVPRGMVVPSYVGAETMA
jgi:hypothetical protein